MSDGPDHKHGKSCGCDVHYGVALIAVKWPEPADDPIAPRVMGHEAMTAMDTVLPALVEAMPEGATIVAPGAEMLAAVNRALPAHQMLATQQAKAAKSARLN